MANISDTLRKAGKGFCSAVLLAAGSSSRMGQDKLDIVIAGRTVMERSLMALERCDDIDEVIVVTRQDKLEQIPALCRACGATKVRKVVCGGKTRTESALAGVSETDKRAKIICIHDAARPFASDELIKDVIRTAVLFNAAAPGVRVKDTIRVVRDGEAVDTPDRDTLYAMQTPQAFHADIIKAALTAAVAAGLSYTDDCAAVEAIGGKVRISRGAGENIKLTGPEDIAAAEAAARAGEGAGR